MGIATKYHQQMVHYLWATVNWNDPGVAAGEGLPFDNAIPSGSIIIGTDVYVVTAFNAGTTNVLNLGTTPTGVDIVAAAAITNTTGALTQNLKGTTIQAATDLPIYFQFTQTGTAATAGQAIIIIKYCPNPQQTFN
jgi:hypothetical protein